MKIKYFSFVGNVVVPETPPFKITYNGEDASSWPFIPHRHYEVIDQECGMTVYLCKISPTIGHLVSCISNYCQVNYEHSFVEIENGELKRVDNFNPNPVRQLCRA